MPVSIDNLSFANATQALQAGLVAIQSGQYVFDLANIVHADSSSVAVMLAWQRAAAASAKELQFLNTPANIASLASLYGVTELLGLPQQTQAAA
jgi:phospholipid transport system transporter-binding protein